MGQKTHPVGFRIGVNKPHSATWFASYGTYSRVLNEDYKIRQFFEKELKLLYNKAGIAKLEIRRKVNQLELIIYAARPKVISTMSNEGPAFTSLGNNIQKFLDKPKQIQIRVIQIAKSENESSLIAMALADQLEKRIAFRRAMRQISQRLQKSGVKGFKVQVSGRLNGIEIARSEWKRDGRVPLHTLRAKIDYTHHVADTIYGVIGIKVWLFNGE